MTGDDIGKGGAMRFAARSGEDAEPAGPSWKILVVDDDPEVHAVTRLVLRDKVILGRRLEILSSLSAREARGIFSTQGDIACVLLDVVMEDNDSGLRLARFLREEAGNNAVRIILRTGQPGQAPESRVILDYAINDYKEKTELTETKLLTAVVTAIRSYRDIVTIEESRHGLRAIIDGASELFSVHSLERFSEGILRSLISLLYLSEHAMYGMASGVTAATLAGGDIEVYAGTGRYADAARRPMTEVLAAPKADFLRRAIAGEGPSWEGSSLAVVLRNRDGRRGVIYIEDCPPSDEVGMELLELFCSNVSEAFSSVSMYESLERSFHERELLLREVHHRVRNNLQIVSGLVNLALRNPGAAPEEALRQTGRRIESMASIHSCVFAQESLEAVDFAAFLPGLAEDIRADFARGGLDVPLDLELVDFVLPLAAAIPCGLLVTELLGAALETLGRHGEREPLLLRLERLPQGSGFRCLLESGDCAEPIGSPFPEPQGVASQLVSALAAQLSASLKVEGGACLRIELRFEGRIEGD